MDRVLALVCSFSPVANGLVAYRRAELRDRPILAGTTCREPVAGTSEADHCNRPVLAARRPSIV